MSVPLPWLWASSAPIQITRLESNGFGATVVEGTFDGEGFGSFTLPKDVNVVGADALKHDIEFCVYEQIASALRIAR